MLEAGRIDYDAGKARIYADLLVDNRAKPIIHADFLRNTAYEVRFR